MNKYPRCYCLCFDDQKNPLPECRCGHRDHNGLCLSKNDRTNCVYHRFCGNETSIDQGICLECILLVGNVKYSITPDGYECSVCLDSNSFNVTLNCGHSICHECWFGVVSHSRVHNGNVKRRCPLCRDENNILHCKGCNGHIVEGFLCKLCQFRVVEFIDTNEENLSFTNPNAVLKEKIVQMSVILKSKLDEIKQLKIQNSSSRSQSNHSSPAIRVGKYKGETYDFIITNDPSYCEWVLRLTSCNGEMKKFQQYIRQTAHL